MANFQSDIISIPLFALKLNDNMLTQIIFALLFLGIAVNAAVTQEEITAAHTALTTAIQLNNRCITSADCTTVPTGHRACGGPGGYAVYAVKSSNAQIIRSLAQETTRLEQQYNEENSIMSICSIVMPAKPVCQTNKCVAASTFGPV